MIPGHRLFALLAAVLCLLILPGCSDDDGESSTAGARDSVAGGFDADAAFADLEAMVDLGPRPSGSQANARQAEMLASELEQAGVEDVAVGEGLRNVTGTIPGEGRGYVVLELARALPSPLPGPSLAIALFDGEEARGDRDFEQDGTRGSRAWVATAERGGDAAAGIPPLDEVEAMVLLDMVGDCDLQIPREFSSDERLYDAFSEAAGGAPFEGVTGSILDDHVPFLERGIPAVDLIDFTYGGNSSPGEYWHTNEDTIDKVCPESLDAVGEAALEAIPQLP